MKRKVKLDTSKVEWDGSCFKVVLSGTELVKKFKELKEKISQDLDNSPNLNGEYGYTITLDELKKIRQDLASATWALKFYSSHSPFPNVADYVLLKIEESK